MLVWACITIFFCYATYLLGRVVPTRGRNKNIVLPLAFLPSFQEHIAKTLYHEHSIKNTRARKRLYGILLPCFFRPSARRSRMQFVASKICRASDIGVNDNLFGGAMLSWLDEAGAVFAAFLCRSPNIVTLKMEEVRFRRPVHINHHVRIYAALQGVGSSSVTIDVEARVYDFASGQEDIVCTTRVVYVQINEQGRPFPIDQQLRETMANFSMHCCPKTSPD